jgi:hypothetical protein
MGVLAAAGVIVTAGTQACSSTTNTGSSGNNNITGYDGGKEGGTSGTSGTSGTGGTSGTSGTGADGGTCPDPGQFGSRNPTCNTCIQSKCGTQVNACFQGTGQAACDCRSIFDCLQSCRDQACANACGTQFPSGVQLNNAWQQCIVDSCEAAGDGGTAEAGADAGDGGSGAPCP